MAETSIEWTDKTWNPVVGCTRVSPGCEHCYAETMASRQVLMSVALGRRSPYLRVVDADNRRWTRAKDVKADPANHQHVELLPERLNEPLSFKPGTRVFVCSMSDLFHDAVPFEFILKVWAVMAVTPRVTYQVLTKRPARMGEFLRWLATQHKTIDLGTRRLPGPAVWAAPLPNVWLGTSVEDQQRADERIPLLLAASAAVRFLSAEPLLGLLDLGRWLGDYDCHSCGARFWGREVRAVDRLVSVGEERDPSRPDDAEAERDVCPRCGQPDLGTGDVGPVGGDYEGQPTIDWVIVGGESGPGARPMDPSWVRSLSTQCHIADAAFFFKQWGGARKKQAGRELDGRTHDAMPGVSHG
ncbi:MAG: DUF5131 family protein [Gemmatimonadales bacterium]|nr:DUF5131 family protein [Gemmatimonadales bacterium]